MCPQNLSPTQPAPVHRGLKSGLRKRSNALRGRRGTPASLLAKEVLGYAYSGNKNPRFAGILEPSDGLEPSNPSLPSRVFAGTFVLQIGPSARVANARA
jgi:hypothetical protein